MALSSHTTSATITETPSTALSSLSTTNSSSLFSSPTSTAPITNKNTPTKQTNTNKNVLIFGSNSPKKHIESSLSTKDIVIQLRQLSQNPHRQIHLINNRDSLRILSDTLLETTTRSSIETCIISLQTLQLLAANPNHRITLQSIPNLVQRIDNLCASSQQRVQTIAKQVKETINSKITTNKYQQYQPRPLHKIEFTIINLNNERDRDEIQTTAIKINGIISVTVNMSTRDCVFYTTRKDVKNSLAQSLRSNGFQVRTAEEKDFDAVASIHSGISNLTDINNKIAQLSSLKNDKKMPRKSANSIIQERYNDELQYVNDSGYTSPKQSSNAVRGDSGPSYIQPQSFSRTGITKYKAKQNVMSLTQRLEFEQKLKEDEEKKKQHTQSFLAKVIAYIW